MDNDVKKLWVPKKRWKSQTHLMQYMNWLEQRYDLKFTGYDGLWRWSVEDTRLFWKTIWEYFEVISYTIPSNVHSSDPMPDTKWFSGARLNYAEHIFRQKRSGALAIISKTEKGEIRRITWDELEQQVATLAEWLKGKGIEPGDRIVAYLPNIPEATIAFLATISIGGIWSSCSPDFGSKSVIERFQQIQPKILFCVDGYTYNGKPFDRKAVVETMCQSLPTLEQVVIIPFLDQNAGSFTEKGILWKDTTKDKVFALEITALPFEHPIWILYSSGTTGKPKAITHSHGGILLEHLKYLAFHNDVHPGENYFWYSTTGWMMWNFVQASLLMGATIILYEGSPAYPGLMTLWEMVEELDIQHFGTSAPYLVACMKESLSPCATVDFSRLRSVGSTGAPLPPEAFEWVYDQVKEDVWLASISGGTDVCTAFVGGVPTEPVYAGEIQRRGLGCAMYAYDESGQPVTGAVGEMVITKPMPCMPIYFWNDPGKERYQASYFEMYPGGIWRHGDWLKITERNTLMILGRSDATLNRHGIRIGTAEIYRAMDQIPAIKDSLIVNLELEHGQHYMPIFILLNEGYTFDDKLTKTIKGTLRETCTPRHVPDEVIPVSDIPYTISGKKMEAPVKRILLGMPLTKAANVGAMRNPESLDFFVKFASRIHKN